MSLKELVDKYPNNSELGAAVRNLYNRQKEEYGDLKIYESPDGGKTVYERPFGGSYEKRKLINK